MPDYATIKIIVPFAILIIVFIIIQPMLYRMRQRQQMIRLVDTIIDQVYHYGRKNDPSEGGAYKDRSSSSWMSWIFIIGLAVTFMLYQQSGLVNKAGVVQQNKTGTTIKSDLTTPNQPEEKPDEYSPWDAPRKRGIYQAPTVKSPESTNSTPIEVQWQDNLSGYGQQIISLHSRESVMYNLERALKYYPNEKVLIIEDEDADGNLLYKGVIGRFERIDQAREAFPDLAPDFKGRFPVDLEGLVAETD